MDQRNANLDLVRVAATFAIVWLHVAANVMITNPDVHSTVWWTGNIADALSRWAVPAFVMLSGALLLSRPAERTPFEFYRKRAARLLVPLVFWTLFYLVFRAYTSHQFNLIDAVISVIRGDPYFHLWYLYMLVGLYFVTPLLQSIVTTGSPVELKLFVAGSLVVSILEAMMLAWFGAGLASFVPLFLPYVGYFTLGFFLVRPIGRLPRRILIAAATLSWIVASLGTGALVSAFGPKSWRVFHNSLGPIMLVMSVCIFLLFVHHPLRSPRLLAFVRVIAPLTLGIYAIHPFWQWVLGKLGIDGFFVHPLLGIPLTSVAVFVLSTVSAMLLAAVPWLRRTVR